MRLAAVLVLDPALRPDHGAVLGEEEAHERAEAFGRRVGELDPALVERPRLAPDAGADALVVQTLQAEPPLGVDVPAEEEVEDEPGIRKEQEDGDPRERHGRVPALDEDDREDDGEVEEQECRLDEAERVGSAPAGSGRGG